jgi:SAM-dependent methyltransferase
MDTLTQDLEIKWQQRDSWNRFSSGWRKWDGLAMRMLKPAANTMLGTIPWRDCISILDVASGTGEPGLTAAALKPTVNVLATDLSEEMVAVARATARVRGLSNFRVEVASADDIPSPDNRFDAVLCRYGFMFFPNIDVSLAELRRVLRPGGRLIAGVWSSPAKNQWATMIMNVIRDHVALPSPSPDAPGLFRCADAGALAAQFRRAGLRDVRHEEIEWTASYDTPAVYWDFITEVAAPVVAGLAKADPSTRERIRTEVLRIAEGHVSGGALRLTCATHVLSGIK